jgi:hypothetical protein
MKQKTARKAKSKLLRLEIRDDIASFLRESPLYDMVETQVGNHIYSGSGKLKVGNTFAPVTLRIRVVNDDTMLYLSAPSVHISIACSFGPGQSEILKAVFVVRESITKSLN